MWQQRSWGRLPDDHSLGGAVSPREAHAQVAQAAEEQDIGQVDQVKSEGGCQGGGAGQTQGAEAQHPARILGAEAGGRWALTARDKLLLSLTLGATTSPWGRVVLPTMITLELGVAWQVATR